jgi:KRAB domain-containing zinc finger protein
MDHSVVLNGNACKVCNKQFSAKDDLDFHVKLGCDYIFKCKCGKTFSLATAYKTHQLTHSIKAADKPYKCKICKKSFNQLSTLIYHKIKHNK